MFCDAHGSIYTRNFIRNFIGIRGRQRAVPFDSGQPVTKGTTMHRTNERIRFSLAVVVAVAALAGATGRAEARIYDTAYLSNALELQRGALERASSGATYLDAAQACDYVQEKWGWHDVNCVGVDRLVFDFLPAVDSLVVYHPNAGGHVRFDDWSDDDRDAEIDALWAKLGKVLDEQGSALGIDIHPERWRLYPTLNERQAYLYYAIELNWGGETILNVRATQFDRTGYVSFVLVPSRQDVSDTELRHMIEDVLSSYTPKPQQGYHDFRAGDRVAAIGVVGVLASLIGVKHTRSAITVAIADALGRFGDYWYLSFLSIALFARRVFR
jgi:hypothetical protein